MAAQPKALAPDTNLEAIETAYDAVTDEHPLARLKAVHDEAAETSQLANLLGRSLYVGLLLPVLALAAIGLCDPPLTRGISFAVLVLMGACILLYAHGRAMRAPFDLAVLTTFSADLDAILLYTGFAWGAGAFLILPTNIDPALTTLFSGCTAAIVAMIVRSRRAVIMFAAPVGSFTALAALLRPLELPFISAALAVTACFFVAGSVALSSWMKQQAADTSTIQPA